MSFLGFIVLSGNFCESHGSPVRSTLNGEATEGPDVQKSDPPSPSEGPIAPTTLAPTTPGPTTVPPETTKVAITTGAAVVDPVNTTPKPTTTAKPKPNSSSKTVQDSITSLALMLTLMFVLMA